MKHPLQTLALPPTSGAADFTALNTLEGLSISSKTSAAEDVLLAPGMLSMVVPVWSGVINNTGERTPRSLAHSRQRLLYVYTV